MTHAEPLRGGTDQAGEVALDVLNVVELGGKGVVDVDDDDLPVGLALVKESHDAKDLDLLDLADVADGLADLTDVEGVVVAVGAGLGVLGVGVLPGLGERTVVPDVTVVGEAVTDVTELALLGVCLLVRSQRTWCRSEPSARGQRPLQGWAQRPVQIALPLALAQRSSYSPWRMGLNFSSLEISIFALVQRGTSTIMLRMVWLSSA